MSKEVAISVMITYYNQKEFIRESLLSVINQKTDFEYEIICSDDGSTDGTYEMLLQWQDKFPNLIKVIQMERDQGKKYEPIVRVSNSRLEMYKIAAGKYVSFLDGDDYYIDMNKLQKQYDVLERHKECSACGTPFTYVWQNSNRESMIAGNLSDRALIIPKHAYWSCIWLHADTFLYRNYYKNNLNDINHDVFDDNLITCYFLRKGNIIYIPGSTVAYRQLEGSSWNDRNEYEKALVNMLCYTEAKKILKRFRLSNLLRHYSVFKIMYENRAVDWHISGCFETILQEKFVERTVLYMQTSRFKKQCYCIRYSYLTIYRVIHFIVKKLQKILYKKI